MMNNGGGMLASERPKYWQSKLFTASGTWTVPADVGCIWVDASAGGSGGSGGHNATTGYGGCGGAPGQGVLYHPLPVVPGDLLTLTVGAGSTGGAAGADSSPGGQTSVIPATSQPSNTLRLDCFGNAVKGTAIAGGSTNVNGSGQLFASTRLYPRINVDSSGYTPSLVTSVHVIVGGIGGAPNTNGGFSGTFGSSLIQTSVSATIGQFVPGGIATTDLGGGGSGGHSPWGRGGAGGNGGVAGANATGYGAGGGGGGGNAAGGNGSPGFIRLYALSSFPI